MKKRPVRRMHTLAQLDHRHVWHPFTQMRDWLKREPIVIVGGRGAVLRDVRGREYLDANSSIWTNLHGHRQPAIDAAIRAQLKKIAHSSALGFANEPASLLAARLVAAANPPTLPRAAAGARRRTLGKVFFSDDGSTAMEVALKLAFEHARRSGRSDRPRFLSLDGAYHGDTIGAVSLGQIDLFHGRFSPLLFPADKVMAPYCYRCPFNRARPGRSDAREERRCAWECVSQVEKRIVRQRRRGRPYAAFVVEPLMQGAAGMIAQPPGWLRRVAGIVQGDGAALIADEVLTGFGRTGVGPAVAKRAAAETGRGGRRTTDRGGRAVGPGPSSLFASHHEGVQPDFLAVAKGLTGGYVPMAATLTTQAVFDSFLGRYDEFKTFFHGHSFTGNQIGSAAALASLDLLESEEGFRRRARLERWLAEAVGELWRWPQVGDIRQVGLIVGVELVRDWRKRTPFDLRERAGIRVCEAMAERGVLTRPIGNVVVLMPPYCSTEAQVRRMTDVLGQAIAAVFGGGTI